MINMNTRHYTDAGLRRLVNRLDGAEKYGIVSHVNLPDRLRKQEPSLTSKDIDKLMDIIQESDSGSSLSKED